MKHLILVASLLLANASLADTTVYPGSGPVSSQQSWQTTTVPDSTWVLGQGGTVQDSDIIVNTSDNKIYAVTDPGTFDVDTQTYTGVTFKEYLFDSNVASIIGVNSSRNYTKWTGAAFNTSRTPNSDKDVFINVSVALTSTLLASATAAVQIDISGTWTTVGTTVGLTGGVATTENFSINLPIPAGSSYKVISTGTATLTEIWELSN